MIRSNPGVIILREGTILDKWAGKDVPDVKELQDTDLTAYCMYSREQMQRIYLVYSIILLFFVAYLLIPRRKGKKKQLSTNNSKHKDMRKKIVAGNWKMNKTFAEGVELAREVNDYVRYKEGGEGVLVVLGTPFIHLAKVAHNITESSIMVAAQNCATEKAGAYTGEISAEMIASTGAKCVILGHSKEEVTMAKQALFS